MIPVTQPFLPKQEEYHQQISQLWESKWITHNGVLVQELEQKLIEYLNVESLYFVNNGTLALQLALKALDITGEVITTPFSFVATTHSIIWENCVPVFVDISPNNFCIDPHKIEEAITDKTEAIMATHVYGIPCDVEKIDEIARRHNLKVIYDGAHAFNVKYKGKSVFEYGDINTLSFHATKVFHTVEGGGIICNGDVQLKEKVSLLRSYGYNEKEFLYVGINAKNTEFHAAMGLCNLKHITENIAKRKKIFELYHSIIDKELQGISIPKDIEFNYAYYPIILNEEKNLLRVQKTLNENNIQTRRYFHPSLNKLPYIKNSISCPISEDISSRVLCLPLFSDLCLDDAKRIANLVHTCK